MTLNSPRASYHLCQVYDSTRIFVSRVEWLKKAQNQRVNAFVAPFLRLKFYMSILIIGLKRYILGKRLCSFLMGKGLRSWSWQNFFSFEKNQILLSLIGCLSLFSSILAMVRQFLVQALMSLVLCCLLAK